MTSASKTFVDAHAPHRPCALPLFARVHIDPCERRRAVGRGPRLTVEGVSVQNTGDLVL